MIFVYAFTILYFLFLIITSSINLSKIENLIKKKLQIAQILLYSLGFLNYLILSFHIFCNRFLKRYYLCNRTLFFFYLLFNKGHFDQ